jgi:hypothetical protein
MQVVTGDGGQAQISIMSDIQTFIEERIKEEKRYESFSCR